MIDLPSFFKNNRTRPKKADRSHQALKHLSVASPPRVLLVDDDTEILNSLTKIFRKFGCPVQVADRAGDAFYKINHCVPDIIILDWMLDRYTGQYLLQQCEENIRNSEELRERFVIQRPKVITFSSRSKNSLSIESTGFFEVIDHWQKPLKFNDLTQKTASLLAI